MKNRAVAYASEPDAGPFSGRKGLQRLLKGASNKEFDAVIVDRVDRFGDHTEVMRVFRHLQANGVKLFDQTGEVTADDLL